MRTSLVTTALAPTGRRAAASFVARFAHHFAGWRAVPRRAVVLGLAIALVIMSFAGTIVWNLRVSARDASLRASRDVLRSISHDIERSLETYDLSLKSVANDLRMPRLMELPVEVRDRVLFDSSTRAKYLGPIRVVDRRGDVVIDSTQRSVRRSTVRNEAFFRFHASHDDEGLTIHPPFKDDDGRYRVTLSRRVSRDDGSFDGVVAGTIELAYFEDLFSKLELG